MIVPDVQAEAVETIALASAIRRRTVATVLAAWRGASISRASHRRTQPNAGSVRNMHARRNISRRYLH